MAQNPYLASQLSGPYAQALINAVQNEIVLASGEMSFMYGMNIITASGGTGTQLPGYPVLATIGDIIGYTWPVVPFTLIQNSGMFTFTSDPTGIYAPVFVTYSGFGSVLNMATLSGVLSSVYANSYIPLQLYQTLLPLAARIKTIGLTLSGIDSICQVFGNHTIAFAGAPNYADVKVTFNPDITPLNLYVANALFLTFATEPQVLMYNI